MPKTYRKAASPGELLVYEEILDPLADRYNPRFSTLILPKALFIDREAGILTLPFFEGETFNDRWNEETGGSLLGTDLAEDVPRVLEDLARIDTDMLLRAERLADTANLRFDHTTYLEGLPSSCEKFQHAHLLTPKEIRASTALLAVPYRSKMVLGNGDFYPRNFIRTPEGRMVLVDWEPWNAHSPFYLVDHPENAAAVCFVHMWMNPAWQQRYVAELRTRVAMERADFQKGVLIKSLRLADFWFESRPELCRQQIALFRSALTEEYMERLWGQGGALARSQHNA